ncbi:MAG: carbohydrate ABC transporter permease [Burkholderiales bacterium]|nr:carbohydrate ABC transporter permease [Burkholderiales bacterium]MDE2454086.1 carbohydrate ABC transporter permease [Burkholderiales bacterium]
MNPNPTHAPFRPPPAPVRLWRAGAPWLRRAVLWAFAVWCLFPIYWLVTMSLKTDLQSISRPPLFLFTPTLQNYAAVAHMPEVWGYFASSSIIAIGSTALGLALGVPTAYVLARYRFRGNADFGFWILSTRMTPPVAMLIPFFALYVRTGLVDTYVGVIIAHFALNLSIVVWLMKGFFEDLPPELEEAAFMDGASYFQAFRQICLPLALPGIAAVGILSFLFSWNEFLFSMVLTQEIRTVPLGLYNFVGYQEIRWGELSASAVLMLAPVLAFVFVFQRQLVRGLTMGAIK